MTSNLIPADWVDDETWEAIIAARAGEQVPGWLEDEAGPLER